MARAIMILAALFSHFLWSVHALQVDNSLAWTSATRIAFLAHEGSRSISSRMFLPRMNRNVLNSAPELAIEGTMNEDDDELTSLKVELAAYLQKRREVGADELAKQYVA
jgi:hypothetical protein